MAVPNGPELQQTVKCENEPCEDEDEEVSEGADQLEERDTDYLADASGEMIQEWLQVRGTFESAGSRSPSDERAFRRDSSAIISLISGFED
jgi:hypothetical protein